jgi:hypothetical protein
MKNLLNILQIAMFVFALILILAPVGNVRINAQSGVSQACDALTYKKKITFTSLFNIGNFLPLIPEECGIDSEQGVAPLPFYFLFDIIVRTAGFLFSFAFFILPIAIIVYGARILFVSFDPGLNKSDFTQATTIGRTITAELAKFLTGIVIILFSYTIVFTILQTLQINITGDSTQPLTTDLRSFFSVG